MFKQRIARALERKAKQYDESARMLAVRLKSVGYHTCLPDGTLVHPTRESIGYAELLLRSDLADDHGRAEDILRTVLPLQDREPASPSCGVWPWYLEEPIHQMAPFDPNWADFIGASLASILRFSAERLPADLRGDVESALGLAVEHIIRRNVGPGYTNIAIMGAVVTLAAGEWFGREDWLVYGRSRLRRILDYTRRADNLDEYNSPTYTVVAINELERLFALVTDPAARADAEGLHRLAWRIVSEHFHAGTRQWCGPNSRTYSNWLSPHHAAWLGARTGVDIPARAADGSWCSTDPANAADDIPPVACPADYRPRFDSLPAEEVCETRRLIGLAGDAHGISETVWMTPQACLGTVSRDVLWTQRRTLLGYWSTPNEVAACLRLRFLHDGRDFSSAVLRSMQAGPRVLGVVGLADGFGDYHIHLDRPADGVFAAEDFRMRIELLGHGVTAERDGERLVLGAGDWRAVVHPAVSLFDGANVTWELTRSANGVCVDAVCYAGPRRGFHLASLGATRIVFGLELLPADAPARGDSPTVQERLATWGELAVDAPNTVAAMP